MKANNLFNENINDSYLRFVKEIMTNKPISSYPELDKYRTNIKTLLSVFNIEKDFFKYGYTDYWTEYIDRVVRLSKEIGDTVISPEFLKELLDKTISNIGGPHGLMDILEALYIPDKVMTLLYLLTCHDLYHRFLFLKEKNHSLDMHQERLNSFYQYMNDLYNSDINPNDIYTEEAILSVIFAYINYHNIDNYDLIKRYLLDKAYFIDKMNMNNIKIVDYQINTPDDPLNYRWAEYIFNDLEDFISKGNIFIK